jgi:hypothetical protein
MSNFIRMKTEVGVDIGLTVYDDHVRVALLDDCISFTLDEYDVRALIGHLQACIVRMENDG